MRLSSWKMLRRLTRQRQKLKETEEEKEEREKVVDAGQNLKQFWRKTLAVDLLPTQDSQERIASWMAGCCDIGSEVEVGEEEEKEEGSSEEEEEEHSDKYQKSRALHPNKVFEDYLRNLYLKQKL